MTRGSFLQAAERGSGERPPPPAGAHTAGDREHLFWAQRSAGAWGEGSEPGGKLPALVTLTPCFTAGICHLILYSAMQEVSAQGRGCLPLFPYPGASVWPFAGLGQGRVNRMAGGGNEQGVHA